LPKNYPKYQPNNAEKTIGVVMLSFLVFFSLKESPKNANTKYQAQNVQRRIKVWSGYD